MRGALAGLILMLAPDIGAAQDFTTYKGHGGPVMGLALGPGGRLASASFDNSVGLWDGPVPVWLDGHAAAVNTVLFWSRHLLVSGADDFTVRMWSDSGASIVLGRHRGKVMGLDICRAGANLVASAGWDGAIGLWDIGPAFADLFTTRGDWPTVRFLLGHNAAVNDVAFGADCRLLYSASSDGTLRVWDAATGQETRQLVRGGFALNELVLGPRDAWLAYGAVDGSTRVIDTETGTEIADFTLDRRPILALEHDAASAQLAVGDGQGYIMIIDTETWKITRDFRAMRQGPVWALAFSPGGAVIHAGGLDDVIYAWPVDLLDSFDPAGGDPRSFLRDAGTMPNGERQFMRKCSICHALDAGPSRKAGPTLYGLFGRAAGTVPGYRYSGTLDGSDITWDEATIDALFDRGPDHYIPGSKMPMQVIAKPSDRADLIAFLKQATKEN